MFLFVMLLTVFKHFHVTFQLHNTNLFSIMITIFLSSIKILYTIFVFGISHFFQLALLSINLIELLLILMEFELYVHNYSMKTL